MAAELPETYYLDNVRTLFRHIESVYDDILEPEYLNFLQDFDQLSEDAQKLMIRLFNRTGTLFRQSKLSYPEIQSIPGAIEELETNGFIDSTPPLQQEEILSLFNIAELTRSHHDPDTLKGLNRADLENYLIDENRASFIDRLVDRENIISILQQDSYQILQMIFFGNLNQSMTDFVLRDLGLYQYENYQIDRDSRPYQCTEQIQLHWLLHQMDSYLQLIDPADSKLLLDCFDSIPDCDQQPSPLFRKSERLKLHIARQLERLGLLDQALSRYRQCRLPPSRERRARILHKQGEIESSIDLCLTIIDNPLDDAEYQFASEFADRLIRQHKIKTPLNLPAEIKYQPDIIQLTLPQQSSVERAVVDYYCNEACGQSCYYLENSLFNSVLGLLIWKALFAEIPGAFHNPFQYRPSDYYDHDFVQKRQPIFDAIWASVNSNEDIWQRVHQCWQYKQGLANPLVDWQHIDLDIIELALQRIPFAHWMAVFNRLLADLRNNRSGFPDLIVFPHGNGYLLVEVKGPGDSLQKNQQRWMQYFAGNDIPHLVAQVDWLSRN